MKKSLLRRMAPLVAGMLILGQCGLAVATYPYIYNITWPEPPYDQYATVYVYTGGSVPSGYVEPRSSTNNYYWFFGATYSGYCCNTTIDTMGEDDSVSVYVYGTDNDYSWATVSRTYGTLIDNGP